MLAMLLEMTSTFISWASIPVAPISMLRIMGQSPWLSRSAEHAHGVAQPVVLGVDQIGDPLVRAGHVDNVGHLGDRLDVGGFHHALYDRGSAVLDRRLVGAVQPGMGGLQTLLI